MAASISRLLSNGVRVVRLRHGWHRPCHGQSGGSVSDPATFQLIAAGLTFLPALVWAVMAQAIASFTRKRSSKGTVQRVLLALTCLVAAHYALWSLFPLLASHLRGEGNTLTAFLLAVGDVNVVALMAAARHFVLLWPIRAEAPGRGWLAVNYGS